MTALRPWLLPLVALVVGACSAPAQPETSTGTGGAGSGGKGGSAASAGAGGSTSSGGTAPAAGGTESGGMGGGGTSSSPGGAGAGGTESGGMGGGASGAGGAAPEGVPDGYTLQFEESFASPESTSALVFANPNDWAHVAEDGGYFEWTGFSYAPPHYSPHSLAVIKSAMFGSFVLDVELWQTSMTGGHRDSCIFWGMAGPSQFYYAHIGQAHDGASHNIHIVNNAGRTAITQIFTDGFDWGEDWQTIRVVRDVQTGSMAVYGNGSADPMLTATDTTLGEGYIGFGAFDDTGRVRNVRIWAPSSTTQEADFFTAK